MNNWWKSPVLQGEENDYGDYDYMIEEIPKSSREWSVWEYKCSECGKWHKLNVVYTDYFYTLDGYDSLSTEVCWLCEMKSIIGKPFRKMKRKIKTFKTAREYYKATKHLSFEDCYKLAKILQK
nr:MAG TPA: Rubredoxin metal binding domain [Caudoviricetes sp.]